MHGGEGGAMKQMKRNAALVAWRICFAAKQWCFGNGGILLRFALLVAFFYGGCSVTAVALFTSPVLAARKAATAASAFCFGKAAAGIWHDGTKVLRGFAHFLNMFCI
ncbi:hypothetical protein NPIL_367471 [Nephila pilipes]|uniref:Uncharacterized protein n=1 Tax=Nephila pilipes TaxID=299642 RepID=A0A8X6U386_NEPPI|nr:hypothetical protein NPIL_367471 [Nephila pilipes]